MSTTPASTNNNTNALLQLEGVTKDYGTRIVTHDRLAEQCDRIVHLVDGRVDSDRQLGASR